MDVDCEGRPLNIGDHILSLTHLGFPSNVHMIVVDYIDPSLSMMRKNIDVQLIDPDAIRNWGHSCGNKYRGNDHHRMNSMYTKKIVHQVSEHEDNCKWI